MTEHAETSRSLNAADKNTNEGSQVENVSTVVLIDLTDTSSVSQRRELVARRWQTPVCVCVCVAPFWPPFFFFFFFFPPLCFAPSHSLNIASPAASLACPLICHSVAVPLFFHTYNILAQAHTHTHAHTLRHRSYFRGHHSDPIPVVLSPKHEKKNPPPSAVHLSAWADIGACRLTLLKWQKAQPPRPAAAAHKNNISTLGHTGAIS